MIGKHHQSLPSHDVDRLLEYLPSQLGDIAQELRSLIFSVSPTATESIHRKGFTYYHQDRGGPVSAGICQIRLHRDHIRLAFVHGVFLPDPERLLHGDEKYMRYVRLDSFEQTPWDYLKMLIVASSKFDP